MTNCQSITKILRIFWVRCIPSSLRSKTRLRATHLLPTWIYSCRSGGTVSCALPFTTNVTISTSISQTFCSWVAIFHLSLADGVFISQLTRYSRACSSNGCFILRPVRLSSQLIGQEYVRERLESSRGKFDSRYGDPVKHYEVSLFQMLQDILGHDHIQWHPQLIRHYTNLRTYYRAVPYYRFWPYYQTLEVSIEHCNGCGMPTEDAYSSGHLVLSHFGNCICSNIETIFI